MLIFQFCQKSMKSIKTLYGLAISTSVALMLCSAAVGNMYVQKRGEQGWLFHIFSQKIPRSSDRQESKSCSYDYTYLEQTDSITILSTITLPYAGKPSDMTISYCGTKYGHTATTVFVKPSKNGYEYRLKSAIPFEVWDSIYSCSEPFILKFSFEADGTKKSVEYRYSDKKWKSQKEKMSEIINVIRFNTAK